MATEPTSIAEELVVVLHACTVGRSDVLSNAITALKQSHSAAEVADLISNLRNEENESPLHICASKGHSDAIRVLLNVGVDPSLRVKRKQIYDVATEAARRTLYTYLLERIAMEDKYEVERLLIGGLPLNGNSDPVLLWACSFGYVDIVTTLLVYGANIYEIDKDGNTALHIAVKYSYLDIVIILLNENCDSHIKNKEGQTAVDIASTEEIKSILMQPIEPSMVYTRQSEQRFSELMKMQSKIDGEEDELIRRVLVDSGFLSESENEGEEEDERQNKAVITEESINEASDPLQVELLKRDLMLWPLPKRHNFTAAPPLELNTSELVLVGVASKSIDILPLLTWSGFSALFSRLKIGFEVQRSPTLAKLRLCVDASLCPGTHRFQLEVTSSYASIIASETTGLMYALNLFVQYLQLYGEVQEISGVSRVFMPCIEITDWPDVPNRAVMWSYKESCLSASASLKTMVDLFSKLRINRLILLLGDDVAEGIADEKSVSIYSLDEVCRHYCVELIPSLVLSNPSVRISNCILKNFSNSVLFLIFLFEETSCNVEESVLACKENLLAAQSAGITSVNIACTPWMRNNCHPSDIASSIGLRAVEQSLESLCSFDLSMKSLSSVDSIIENISKYAHEVYSKGLSSSILPGLLDSFFVSPLCLTKFYTFLHAGYSWNRTASKRYFEGPAANISGIKDIVRMLLFPSQYLLHGNSDVYHNTDVILGLLSNSRSETSSESVVKPAALFHTENLIWCMLTSFENIENVKIPSKVLVAECLRNYKRILASSRWTLGQAIKASGRGIPPTADSAATLDADEFFCVMHMLCILCKLVIYGYNVLEKRDDIGSPSKDVETLGSLVASLPIGTKSDLANSFLLGLEHSMVIWRCRFASIGFKLNMGGPQRSPVDALQAARSTYLMQQRLCFPAVKVLTVICAGLPIAASVNDVLERIFGVKDLLQSC